MLRFALVFFAVFAFAFRVNAGRFKGIGRAKRTSAIVVSTTGKRVSIVGPTLPSYEKSEGKHHSGGAREESARKRSKSSNPVDYTDGVPNDFSTVLDDKNRRQAIAHYFVEVLFCPPEIEWDGVDGTISTIQKALKINSGSRNTIKQVISEVLECHEQGIVYSGDKHYTQGGQMKLIKLGSVEEQIAADAIEGGLGYRQATLLVNEYRAALPRPEGTAPPHNICIGAVHGAMMRLKPVTTQVLISKQGSFDASSGWAMARHKWTLQLLVRFGEWTGLEAWLDLAKATQAAAAAHVVATAAASPPSSPADVAAAAAAAAEANANLTLALAGSVAHLPPYFNLSLMSTTGALNVRQVAFWDEKHCKPIIGGHGHGGAGAKSQTRFMRDEHGAVILGVGTLAEKLAILNVKYASDEWRACLGVHMILTHVDGAWVDVGYRLPMFDYSGQYVRTEEQINIFRAAEIARVKAEGGSGWITGGRVDGEVYQDDPTTQILGIAGKKAAILSAAGINTVQDLIRTPVGTKIPDMSAKALNTFIGKAKAANALEGAFPEDRVVNHKHSENPYLSRYGELEWKNKIDGSTSMKGSVSIQKLMTHIMTATAAAYSGTKYETSWLVYHDALSSLTSGATQAWMKVTFTADGRSYFDCMVNPLNGLNAGTVYAGRPVGNSPEMMPLDSSLNKDLDDCVALHVTYCNHMVSTDPGFDTRFSRSTSTLQDSTYGRLYDPSHGPHAGGMVSSRIIQDILKVLPACAVIAKARGICCPGLGSRNGHRKVVGKAKRGGVRVRAPPKPAPWLHPDVLPVKAKMRELAIARHGRTAMI